MTITAHDAGILKKSWKNRRFKRDKPLKRAFNPLFGGVNMIKSSPRGCEWTPILNIPYRPAEKYNQGAYSMFTAGYVRCCKSGRINRFAGWLRSRAHYWRLSSSRCMASCYLVRERELQFADLQSNLEDPRRTIRLREELAGASSRCCKCTQEMAAKIRLRYSPARRGNAQEAVQRVLRLSGGG